jgi:hypothetical protein
VAEGGGRRGWGDNYCGGRAEGRAGRLWSSSRGHGGRAARLMAARLGATAAGCSEA